MIKKHKTEILNIFEEFKYLGEFGIKTCEDYKVKGIARIPYGYITLIYLLEYPDFSFRINYRNKINDIYRNVRYATFPLKPGKQENLESITEITNALRNWINKHLINYIDEISQSNPFEEYIKINEASNKHSIHTFLPSNQDLEQVFDEETKINITSKLDELEDILLSELENQNEIFNKIKTSVQYLKDNLNQPVFTWGNIFTGLFVNLTTYFVREPEMRNEVFTKFQNTREIISVFWNSKQLNP